MLPALTVGFNMTQDRYLSLLKSNVTFIYYPIAPVSGHQTVYMMVFPDTGRLKAHGQLSFLSGLPICPFEERFRLYNLSWTCHNSKRSVKSIWSAEVLAAG